MVKDPNIVLCIINTKLRDIYQSLDALCEDLNVNKMDIINLLKTIQYEYSAKLNAFIPTITEEVEYTK